MTGDAAARRKREAAKDRGDALWSHDCAVLRLQE